MQCLHAIPLLATLMVSSWLPAQVHGASFGRAGAGVSSPRTFTSARRMGPIGRPAFDRRFPRGAFFLPYYDSDFTGFDEVPPEPQMVVVQPPAPAPEPTRSEAPLLIELQGDRFVRISGNDRQTASLPQPSGSPSRAELPPATLIFRDGTRREVGSYTIVDGVLYADSDYWTSGGWAQPIRLSQLDIPATIASNQQKGVRFLLPGGPHEVVVRP